MTDDDDKYDNATVWELATLRPVEDMVGLSTHGVYLITHAGRSLGVHMSPELATAVGLSLIQAAQRFEMIGTAEAEFNFVEPDLDWGNDEYVDDDNTELDFDFSNLELDDGPPN